MAQVPISVAELYPDLRGEPMECTQQLWAMLRFSAVLKIHYAGRKDVFICGDQLIYYELGDPTKTIVADVVVTFGVPGLAPIGAYRVWEVGKAPDLVLEVVSPDTTRAHRLQMPFAYARMGVRECWRFRPEAQDAAPLAGYRFDGGRCRSIAVRPTPNGAFEAASGVLGLTLEAERFRPGERPEYGTWGLFLRSRGKRLLDHAGEIARADAAEAERDAEIARADAARAQADAARARADALRAQADALRAQADAARARADAAEAECRALRAALVALQRNGKAKP